MKVVFLQCSAPTIKKKVVAYRFFTKGWHEKYRQTVRHGKTNLLSSLVNKFTMLHMKKQQAIDLLGGSPKKAAEAMGYTSAHAVYMWPEQLSHAVTNQVLGVLSRIRKPSQVKEQAVA